MVLVVTLVGCTSSDAYEKSQLVDTDGVSADVIAQPENVILEEAEAGFIAEDDFIEIGEMI